MKIYIVHFQDNAEDQDRDICKAFANKKTAVSFISKCKRDKRANRSLLGISDDQYFNSFTYSYSLREIDIPISKKGLLQAINNYEYSYQNL